MTSRFRNPRWLVVCAWAAFVCTWPSALWRVLMILGLLPGSSADDLRSFELGGDPPSAYAYVFGLSVVQLLAGFLTLGLIRPWGERLAGRRVPVWLAVGLGLLGGAAVVYLFDIEMLGALLQGRRPDAGLVSGPELALMAASYAPIFLWGPLELASVCGYWWRRARWGDQASAPSATRA